MQITTDPLKVLAAIKAVREFVSTDPTRNHIRNIFAEMKGQKLRLTATDGASLCYVEIDCVDAVKGTARLSDIAVETLELRAKHAKGHLTQTFLIEDCKDQQAFPEYSRTIPEKQLYNSKAGAVVGFDGRLLSRVGLVQKAIKGSTCRVQFGGPEAPLRVDLEGSLADAVVIVMPMRLSEAKS